MPWLWFLLFFVLVLFLLRRALHAGLAPERVVSAQSPADLGLDFRELRIATANGKTLFAWQVMAPGKTVAPTVVLMHGWGGSADNLLALAAPLHAAGFAAVFVEARCHGRSDGDSFASLPRFAEDIEHVCQWLEASGSARGIALIGHSVGASASLLVASRRAGLFAAVSIAAFSHPASMMRRWLESKRIPFYPFGWLILRYVEAVIGARFDDIAPINTITRIRCPTLLLHGKHDTTVPLAEAEAIHAARQDDFVQLRTLACAHDDFANHPELEQEISEIIAFLQAALADGHRCTG